MSGRHDHDPLWSVTVPSRPREEPVDSRSADLPTQAVPVAGDTPTQAVEPVPADAPTQAVEPVPADAPTGRVDIGQPDTGQVDAGQPDTGQGEPGAPDAGQPDTGSVDTGRLEALDEPTVPVAATGFASDPLAPTVVTPATPQPVDYSRFGTTGNTAIVTTPMIDPTPARGMPVYRPRRRRWPKRLGVLLLLAVLAVVGYYGISLFQVWQTGNSDHREPVDVIVVLGAAQYDGRPSPQLKARLDHAIELYEEGVAPVVYVTGGNRPGDRFTEAEASRDYLVARGVPALAIAMESTGSTTWESLSNMSGAVKELGFDEVTIVTDPYHSLRAKLIAEELGLVAHVSPTRTSPVQGRSAFWRSAKEAGGVALGRIIGFDRLERIAE